MSWGKWEEDRRYLAEDGEHMIVVSKRVDGAWKTHWKNERRPLSRLAPEDRAYYESRGLTENQIEFREFARSLPGCNAVDAMTDEEYCEHVRNSAIDDSRQMLDMAPELAPLRLGERVDHLRDLVDPVVGVERPKVQRRRWRILEPQEVGRVAAGLTDERARRVFLTLMLTGLRRFELQALRWQDVNMLDGTLRVVESKSEEGERLVALPRTLQRNLEEHYRQSAYLAGSDYVFAHPQRGTRLEHEWYADEFRAALAAAGITDYIRPFHDARHSALTNLAATGASPVPVMATAGHRSMQTTEQYLHLAGVVFRDDAAALEARLLGAGPVQGSGTNTPETALLSGND